MTRPTLLVTRQLPHSVLERLQATYEVTLNRDDLPLSTEQLDDALQQYDALSPTITDKIQAPMLASSSLKTRIIANFGAGFEHIDIAAAQRASVVVTNTPDALTEATAELAILLMLMAARRAGEGERLLRAGRWTGWTPTPLRRGVRWPRSGLRKAPSMGGTDSGWPRGRSTWRWTPRGRETGRVVTGRRRRARRAAHANCGRRARRPSASSRRCR